MIKVKDGYAKLIGTTTTGSASHLLLSNGGVKAVSDFAAASALDNYVTLSTDQSITGVKTFAQCITIQSGQDTKLVLNNTGTESKYQFISFRQDGTQYGYLGTLGDNDLKWTGQTVLHSGNAHIKNGVITINGVSITPLTSHQSLSNYVTLNSAQTISGVKTFSTQQKFTVAEGTSPFTVTSTTKVTNLHADLLDGYNATEIANYGASLHPYNASATGWYKFMTVVCTTNDGMVDFIVSSAECSNYGIADYFHFETRPSSPTRSFNYTHLNANNNALRNNIYAYTTDNKTYTFYMRYTSAGTWDWFCRIKLISTRGATVTLHDGGAWQTGTPSGSGYQASFTGAVAYASSAGSVAWGNVTGKPSTFTPASHNHDDRYYTESEADSRFINAAGDTMTGLLTVTTGTNHGGIKMGGTYVTSIDGSVIFQNNTAIRFGSDSWNWNTWAGLRYNHSNKTIYLGLADNSIFTANAAQSGGSLRFPGISKAWINTSEGNEVLNLGGWLGTVGNTGWYSVTHKGGWYMIDGSYVRTYNNVRVHTGSQLRDAFNSAGGYYSSWNNSVGNDWTSILNPANAVFSKDNQYVNHGTAQPMMTWANTVNSYGYVTRYSIGSVRPNNDAWGRLRLCVGNNDGGTSCGCYMDLDGDGAISTNASIYAAHFYENSDIRLKTNIENINNSDNIPQLKSFDWKDSNIRSYGLIAQELEEQGYSELVSEGDEGKKTVNYSAALSLIVGKLQVKIQEIEKENKELKDELNNLKNNKLWQS